MKLRTEPSVECRPPRTVRLDGDFVIVGGGLAGTCCAITAARAGLKVVLIQDRPVLGGNASSEVRLWILGATSHMGNNNRWAREGGVIDEILVENLYRNPEGNPLIVDSLILERVVSEANITLLLNTAVHDLEKADPDTIRSVRAFCSQNSTQYLVTAPLFCDASGDGIVGFLAGAAFRIGAETQSEFGEKLAPPQANHELLGHALYFYTKDTGRPVRYVAPSFALQDYTDPGVSPGPPTNPTVMGYFYFPARDEFNDPAQIGTYYPGNGALPGGDNLRAHLPVFASKVTDNAYYLLMYADMNRRYLGSFGRDKDDPSLRGANHFERNEITGSNEGYTDGHVEWATKNKIGSTPKMQYGGVDIYFYGGR